MYSALATSVVAVVSPLCWKMPVLTPVSVGDDLTVSITATVNAGDADVNTVNNGAVFIFI